MGPAKTSTSADDAATSADQYHVPNLTRALQILEYLAEQRASLGMSEIADALELPRNSVFRIVSTLRDHGYLARDGSSKKYLLSHKLLSMGYAAIGGADLLEHALDVMQELRDATGETVLIGKLLATDGVVLEQVVSRHPVKFAIDSGTRFPLHTGAPAKAIIAFLPDAEQEAMLSRMRFKRYTSTTITGKRAMREELKDARTSGYAIDRAEHLDGLHCVAAPVMNHFGYPTAAIWVTGPAFRFPTEKFAATGKLVKQHAQRISYRLGHDVAPQTKDDSRG